MDKLLNGQTLDDIAIDRLRCFEQAAITRHENGYWLGFSGGKDSVVIYDLAKRAGVKFEAHFSLTTIDPPEVVRFTRKEYPDVHLDKPRISMAALVRKKKMPPFRQIRYCCKELKEVAGDGRLVVTGIRWEESHRRAKRRMTEACYQNGRKHYLHPIIDWTTSDVWAYIHERNLPYCSLYDEGFTRVGCVLCPNSSEPERDIARWPAIAKMWERTIKESYRPGSVPGIHSAEEMWKWWSGRSRKGRTIGPTLFD